MGSYRSQPQAAEEARVSAWWLFEEDGQWLGFTREVSEKLEEAYQRWSAEQRGGLQSAQEVVPGALSEYVAALSSSTMEGGREHQGAHWMQGIRRLGVLSEQRASRIPPLPAPGSPAADVGGAELEALRRQSREAEARIVELRECCAAVEVSERQLADRLAHCLLPGRVVSWEGEERPAPRAERRQAACGDDDSPEKVAALGRVWSDEGAEVCVNFGRESFCYVPSATLKPEGDIELLARPGTRVRWQDSAKPAHFCRGVACGPAGPCAVRVLGSDGRSRELPLRDLASRESEGPGRGESAGRGFTVGDLVLVARTAEGGSQVGMVVRSDAAGICVRLAASGGTSTTDVEVAAGARAADEWPRVAFDAGLDGVRPGAAVRFRGSDCSELGVVYATHADGTAVVDFLGCLGGRYAADALEVASDAPALESALLRALGELVSWGEVRSQLHNDAWLGVPLGGAFTGP